MNSFKYHVPTPIYYGRGIVKEKANMICGYGTRAFIVTSKFQGGCENKALKDVEEILTAAGISFKVNDNVIENPPTESCVEIFLDALDFKPDFIFGIGGGSSIDTAKAVNYLFQHPEISTTEAATDLFFNSKVNFYDLTGSAGAFPLVAIPTTAGTGADVTAAAVITRNDVGTKATIKANLYATTTFLDAAYVKDSPAFLIHTGVLDALAHAMETYMNVKTSWMARKVAEMEFELFSQFKDNLLADTLTDENFDQMILGASIAGSAMMQSGTTLPHGLGYPLSQFHHVNHGLSCSITLGEYMRTFKDQTLPQKVMHMCGFKDTQDMCDFFQEIIKRDLKLRVTHAEIDQWTDFFWETEQNNRLKRNPEPISKEQIHEMYLKSLAPYIVD